MSNILRLLKTGTEQENYGRDIIIDFIKKWAPAGKNLTVLDIGAGHGIDLLNVKQFCDRPAELVAVENYLPYIKELKEKGIKVLEQDIETQKLKLPDASVDIVIANQIMEHIKEVFWVTSEISRVLKPGGLLLIGVPNLAAWHNRALLVSGKQPTTIEVLSPHVRGYTFGSLKKFLQAGGYFEVIERRGANFYPFSKIIAHGLAKVLPSMAVGIFICARRTRKKGQFIKVLDDYFFETSFRRNS